METAKGRLILEYASTVWDPHQANHIKEIEAIQKIAARLVSVPLFSF